MDAVFPAFAGGGRSAWLRRCGILLVALAVNLMLFAVMPCLLTRNTAPPSRQEAAQRINVVRVHEADSPVKRIVDKPPEPPPERRPPQPAAPRPASAKLSLPFDVNPRLPVGPNTLTLPVMPPARVEELADPFATGDLDSPLAVLVRVPPVYPLSAKNRGTEGWVKVRFIVNEDGSVEDVAVVESEPKVIFDEAVVRSVSGWRFKAGTVGGVPVRTRAETVVRFKLD